MILATYVSNSLRLYSLDLPQLPFSHTLNAFCFTQSKVSARIVFLHSKSVPSTSTFLFLSLCGGKLWKTLSDISHFYVVWQLTWRKHIKTERQHLDLKLRAMSWLLGRRSQLSLPNQLLLYKCILKPVWTYGIKVWGCAKPSQTQILQRLQSKILRSLDNAPWYVSNLQLHTDLGIPFVSAEINRSSLLYHSQQAGHHNALFATLPTPSKFARRLKRRWPSDLHTVTGD